MADNRQWMRYVILLPIAILIGAVFFSTAFGAMSGDYSVNVTQEDNVTYDVKGPLTTNATEIDETADPSTVTLNLSTNDDSTEVTVSNDTSQTATVDGEDVNVSVTDVASDGSNASVTYEGSNDSFWGSLTSAVFTLVAIAGILFFLTLVLGPVLDQVGEMR